MLSTQKKNKKGFIDPLRNYVDGEIFSNLRTLPIFSHRSEIIEFINNPSSQILQVVGPTGSGKSVLTPLFLLANNNCAMISVPTVVATKALFTHVLSLLRNNNNCANTAYNRKINYDKYTKLKYVTTGHCFNFILTHIINRQAFPKNFVMIIDEAHGKNAEILASIYLAKYAIKIGILSKLIVMTATPAEINFEPLNVSTVVTEGRTFPIEITYNSVNYPSVNNLLNAIPEKVDMILNTSSDFLPEGILIFLPGSAEIDTTFKLLGSMFGHKNFSNYLMFKLSSQTPEEELEEILSARQDHPDKIIIILSTNVAESSVTIPYVTSVIDSGLEKHTVELLTDTNDIGQLVLEIANESYSSHLQRIGRSGRVRSGRAFAMFKRELIDSDTNKNLSDLVRLCPWTIVLQMLRMKKRNDVLPIDLILEIPEEKYNTMMTIFENLNIVNPDKSVTSMGKKIADFQLSIKNSIVACNLSTSTNQAVQILGSLILAFLEGSQNAPMFYVGKNSKTDELIDDIKSKFYDRLGENDFVTLICAFSEIYRRGKKHNPSEVKKLAGILSLNNKALQSSISLFQSIITKVIKSDYQNCYYWSDYIKELLLRYDVPELVDLMSTTTMNEIYTIFNDVYSRNTLSDLFMKNNALVGRSVTNGYQYKINTNNLLDKYFIQSFPFVTAIQTMICQNNMKTTYLASFIIPNVKKCMLDEYNDSDDFKNSDNLDNNNI